MASGISIERPAGLNQTTLVTTAQGVKVPVSAIQQGAQTVAVAVRAPAPGVQQQPANIQVQQQGAPQVSTGQQQPQASLLHPTQSYQVVSTGAGTAMGQVIAAAMQQQQQQQHTANKPQHPTFPGAAGSPYSTRQRNPPKQ
jgi:hypothetical protein